MISTVAITVASLKKEPFSGSHHGMRFYMKKSDEGLDVYYYPEPWCFEQTPEEDKVKKTFPLDKDGLQQAMDWLNENFDKQRARWEDIEKRKTQIFLGKKGDA